MRSQLVDGKRHGSAHLESDTATALEILMTKTFSITLAVVLFGHGLIHFIGTAVYAGHARVAGLPYKTTLLGGRWDLGEPGIAVYGGLWALPAIAFVIASLVLVLNGSVPLPLLYA